MKQRGRRGHTHGGTGAEPTRGPLSRLLVALVLVVSCNGANAPPFLEVHPLAVGHPPGSGPSPLGPVLLHAILETASEEDRIIVRNPCRITGAVRKSRRA